MNVGYLYGFNAYPPTGGDRTHAYELIQCLIRRGHTVHTIGDCATPGVKNYLPDDDGIESFIRCIDVLYIRIAGSFLSGEKIKRVCMDRVSVPIVWEINAPANETLAPYKIDPESGRRLSYWRLRRRISALALLPEIFGEERTRRNYARKISAAICVSEEAARYAREGLGIGNTYVLPNGSNPTLFSPLIEPLDLPLEADGRFKVLYAGSPRYAWQGLDLIDRAIDKLKGRQAEILFILLVNQKVQRLPQKENALVFESVDYFQVARYIAAADACICLGRDFTWSRWGFHGSPTKLFDYMACGKPVIASAVGQIRKVVEEGRNGVLVENTSDDIAEKIIWLSRHREEAAQMGRSGRELVARYYNWDRVAEKTLAIFAEVCGRA